MAIAVLSTESVSSPQVKEDLVGADDMSLDDVPSG